MRPAAWLVFLTAVSGAFAIEKTDPEATIVTMKRVYVDRFGGGETAAQIRDMLISALQTSHAVQVTENEEQSDVVLRGSGEDLVFTEDHSATDNLNIHTNSSNSGTSSKGYGSSSGISAGENESNHSSERKHEASAAVRLVNRAGDVIWSATRESQGGKFRGASADVADKLVKQLVQDVERLKASAAKQAGKPVL